MVAAGWYYDPSPELPDGVTCPYCSLSLDSWDAGDNPLEEHRKRSSDCLFFTLKDLYHGVPAPKAKRASRASTTSKKGKAKAKASAKTRASKRISAAPSTSSLPAEAPK